MLRSSASRVGFVVRAYSYPLGRHKGYEYARSTDATREALERNIAALEGGRYGFERRDVALQRLAGGVRGARVLVPLVPAQSLLDVGGRLVDRRHDRAGQRVGDLPGVHRAGAEAAARVVRKRLRHGGNVRAPSAPSKRPLR